MAKETKESRSIDYGERLYENKSQNNTYFEPLGVYMSGGLFAYMQEENKRRLKDNESENAVSVLIEMSETSSPTLHKIIRLLDWSNKNGGLLGSLMSEIRKCGDPIFLQSLELTDVNLGKVYSRVEQVVKDRLRELLEEELGLSKEKRKKDEGNEKYTLDSVKEILKSFEDLKFLAELGMDRYVEMVAGDYMDHHFLGIKNNRGDEKIDCLYNWLYKYAIAMSPLYGVNFDFIDPTDIEALEGYNENRF